MVTSISVALEHHQQCALDESTLARQLSMVLGGGAKNDIPEEAEQPIINDLEDARHDIDKVYSSEG